MFFMVLIFLLDISFAAGNVPQPFPPEDNTFQTSRPSVNPGEDPSIDWQPRFNPDVDLGKINMTNSHQEGSSHASAGHGTSESTEDLRYAVASFDFHHVATPYIISLWIIIVGLAKIGEQRN